MVWYLTEGCYDTRMSKADNARSTAAVELADALLAEFNDPRSALKGIGTVTMEKLLAYAKIAEKPPRKKRAGSGSDGEPESEPESER